MLKKIISIKLALICMMLFFIEACKCKVELSPGETKNIIEVMEKGTDASIKKIRKNGKLDEIVTSYYSEDLITKFDYGNNGAIYKIESNLKGKKYGHSFVFDTLGRISKYAFFVGNDNFSSYKRDFDYTNKSSIEQGSVLVDYIESKDSVDLFFSTIFYNLNKVYIQVLPDNKYYELKLKPSSLMPFLDLATIKKNRNVSNILTIEAKDRYSCNEQVFKDTLAF